MRITVFAVGRLRKGPERDMVDRYLHRAKASGAALGIRDVREVELPHTDPLTEASRFERAADGARAFIFDEHGDAIGSRSFAGLIDRARLGAVDLAFFIGGADGVDRHLRDRADHVIAMGAMTWPHELARVLVAEQIYRGLSILNGHPYHREG